MAQNKGAIVRYRAIDKCLRSKQDMSSAKSKSNSDQLDLMSS